MADLKTWRIERDITQAALAALLGTTNATVCRIEAGEQWPGADLMAAIEAVTDGAVTASDILARHISQSVHAE